MSDSVWPHSQQPTRLLCPWDSLGKNTGVGCHFLLQYHNIPVIHNIHNMHAQSCLTPCHPMDWSPPGSSVHGIFQVRILEWVAMPSSRGFSWPRDQTSISCVSCIGRQILYCWTTWEAWEDVIFLCKINKNLWKSKVVLSGIYQVFVSLILFWNTSVSVNCGLIELVGLGGEKLTEEKGLSGNLLWGWGWEKRRMPGSGLAFEGWGFRELQNHWSKLQISLSPCSFESLVLTRSNVCNIIEN